MRFASVPVKVATRDAHGVFAARRTLLLPPGWSAQVWALVSGARFATWTPQGDLLVSSSAQGTITQLSPRNAAGAPPRQRTLISGLTWPQGMAFTKFKGHDVLYVAESDAVLRYRWEGGAPLGSPDVVASGLIRPPVSGNHPAKTIVVGPSGTLYVTGASASNADPADLRTKPPRGVIFALTPAGKLSVFATGVRNAEGLAIAPDGSLWAAVNQRDDIAYPFHKPYGGDSDAYGQVIQSYVNDHPPDELARITRGRNLGWPYCNPDPDDSPGNQGTALHYANLSYHADAQTNAGGKHLNCAKLPPLERGIPAHSAPLGLTFLNGSGVPARWRNGALLALHGSWNRQPPRAPAVLWLPWRTSGRTLGAPVTLVSGFQTADGQRWGRPVDAVPGPDGNLYVSDDTAGAIYRIGPAR